MQTSNEAPSRTVSQGLLSALDGRPATLLLALLFTLGMLFNYVLPLNSLLYTTGVKGQDTGQMIWNIWFVNEAITSGHSPFSTNQVFYPLGTSLAHHSLGAGFFPLTFLVKALSGNDPLYPFYAYKLIILFSFTLILWLSYQVLREIDLTRWAALIAAVGYTFSDFYVVHILHINHLAGFFIPLTAFFLIRAYTKPASSNLAFAALAASWSVYFTEFSLYICMAGLFFLLIAGLSQPGRRELVSKVAEAGLRRLLIAALLFGVTVAPFAIVLSKDRIRNPPAQDSSQYSANLAGFFIPGQEKDEAELYGTPSTTPLYGDAFVKLDSKIPAGLGVGGFEAFVGFPLLIFSVIAVVKFRRKGLWICVAVGFLFFLLSLGPTLKILGMETGWPLPYSALMKLPPFDAGRTPVRFIVMGLFFLMIVAAHGLSWMENSLVERWGVRGRRWSGATMFLIFAWTSGEVYSATPRRPPFVPPADLSKISAGPVLNLPPVQWDGYAAMLQTFHHQPIATGYLARNSEAQWAQFGSWKLAFDKGGAAFCEYVKSKGFRTVVISPDSVLRPYRFSMSPLDLSRCPVNVVDLRERGPGAFGVPQPDGSEQPVNYPPYAQGSRLNFGSAEVDKYLWFGWSGRETSSHWTERGKATLVFSLAPESARKQAVTLRIFGGPFLAPGKLDAQRVLVRLNEQEIATWNLTRAEPQERSIEIPASMLRGQNVLLFELPDAASPRVLGLSEDWRLLGFNVQWIEID
jgi:hypothetical protein